MPDIWTHILFGEEVLTEMLQDNIFDLPKKYLPTKLAKGGQRVIPSKMEQVVKAQVTREPELFRFACQGPDFFFFYRFWPWKKTHGIDDIGRFIQNDLGGRFVHTAIQYLQEMLSRYALTGGHTYPQTVDNSGDNPVESEEYQLLLTYVIGFICHYALDASAHPFIHHKSGVYRRHEPATYQYYGNHKIFEELIDTILLQEKRGLKTCLEPVHPQIYLGERLPEPILKFYQHQVAELLDWKLELETFNVAYRDMIKGWKLFHDPQQHKYRFVKLVEKLSLGKLTYYQFLYPHDVDTSVDYLNRQEQEWCHPSDQREVYTTSFDQLWDRAKGWAKDWVRVMFQYLQGQISDQQLQEQIPDLSFSTGKAPGSPGEKDMRYFNPVVGLK